MKSKQTSSRRRTIKGVLWHQGEADTLNDERADSYETKLHQLIADLRADLGIADLPFIVGNLGELYGVGENPDPDPGKVARVKKISCRYTDGQRHRSDLRRPNPQAHVACP